MTGTQQDIVVKHDEPHRRESDSGPSQPLLSHIGDNDPDMTVFQQPWWLDAVSDGRYRAVTAGDGKHSYIWWPYLEQRWLWFSLIEAPPFTHTLGPVIRTPSGKLTSRASQRRKLINGALEQAPKSDGFTQVLDPAAGGAFDYVMAGFDVSVRYTFQIETRTTSVVDLWAGLKDKARNGIRRAQQAFTVSHGMSVMAFHRIYEANLKQFGHPNHHSKEIYLRLSEALAQRDRHCIMSATDRTTGELVAATMLIWDANILYYLRATHDGTSAGKSASSLLLWEAIKLAGELGLNFDSDSFVGRTGASFMEAFGASPRERLVISRRTELMKLADAANRRLPKKLIRYPT